MTDPEQHETKEPEMATRLGPQPWAGCDTYSEEWRRYCEAFSHYRDRNRSTSEVGMFRGWAAALILEHDIRVVRADYDGRITDRSVLQNLMQWKPKPEQVRRRAELEKSRRAGRRQSG